MGEQVGRTPVKVFGAVAVAGRPVTPRQGAVLATLALAGGEGASSDVIADATWAGRPPATFRASIQNLVARLRAEFGADLIDTRYGRYRLAADLDVARFERLVSPWTERIPSADAAVDLESARALWGGVPYEPLGDHPPAAAERARLEHLVGIVDERLAVARLLSGDSAGAIAGLTIRTRQAPFQERAWELLMATLYLAGRRLEALAEYERFRATVNAELATEPSGHVQRLHDLIERSRPLDVGEVLRLDRSPLGPTKVGGRCDHCQRPTDGRRMSPVGRPA